MNCKMLKFLTINLYLASFSTSNAEIQWHPMHHSRRTNMKIADTGLPVVCSCNTFMYVKFLIPDKSCTPSDASLMDFMMVVMSASN